MRRNDKDFLLFLPVVTRPHPDVLDRLCICQDLCPGNAHRFKSGRADVQSVLRIRLSLIVPVQTPLLRRSIQLDRLCLAGRVGCQPLQCTLRDSCVRNGNFRVGDRKRRHGRYYIDLKTPFLQSLVLHCSYFTHNCLCTRSFL